MRILRVHFFPFLSMIKIIASSAAMMTMHIPNNAAIKEKSIGAGVDEGVGVEVGVDVGVGVEVGVDVGVGVGWFVGVGEGVVSEDVRMQGLSFNVATCSPDDSSE